MASIYLANYDPTTEHLHRTELGFYEILTKSNDFNQFRDLMMEFIANRPSVQELHDLKGIGRWNSQSYKRLSESDKEYVREEEERISDLEGKEQAFDDKLGSIPYIDNIDTLTKSFSPYFSRPHMYLNEDGTYTSETEFALKYPLKKSVSQSSKEPDLFEGLQIHSQTKGGKNTRKNRKTRK